MISWNGKNIKKESIEIEDVNMNDYPDFCDAYIVSAEYEDGTKLTNDEVDQFFDENYYLTNELIHEKTLYIK